MRRLGKTWTILCGCLAAFVLTASAASDVFPEARFVNVAHAKDGAPIVTFTGLQVHEDGSSTLFVDLTRSAEVQATHAGKDVSFLLAGAKIRDRNNKNPLIAEHFKTNVLRATLVDEAGGVRFVIQLREDVKVGHDMTSSGLGARLRVDVPPPSSR